MDLWSIILAIGVYLVLRQAWAGAAPARPKRDLDQMSLFRLLRNDSRPFEMVRARTGWR